MTFLDDPLIRFIEQLLIVDEALTPEEDTGIFVESLLRVRQALIDETKEWKPKERKTNPGEPTLQRCESDDDVSEGEDAPRTNPEVKQQVKSPGKVFDNIGWSDY